MRKSIIEQNPIRRLWASVMLQAIKDYWTQEHRDGVHAWIHADENIPCGFVWICGIFDIHPDMARACFYRRDGVSELNRYLKRQEAGQKRAGRTIIDEVVHG